MDGKTPRTFCPVRYGLSQSLGQRIVAASAGDVFKSGSKFVFKDYLGQPHGTYVIAFDMRPSKSPKFDVIIQLASAHPRQQVPWMKRTAFIDALNAIKTGQPIVWKKK